MSDFSLKHYVWTSYPTEQTGEVLNMTYNMSYNLRKYFCYKTGNAPFMNLSVCPWMGLEQNAFPKTEIQMPYRLLSQETVHVVKVHTCPWLQFLLLLKDIAKWSPLRIIVTLVT